MIKLFDKLKYSFIFWFYFALLTASFRIYYLDEELLVFNIFPTQINIVFSLLFLLFVVYTFYIFTIILKKSKNSNTNRFLLFIGNIIVTLHLVYTVSQGYNLLNNSILKSYNLSSQIDELKETLPIKINSFTTLVNVDTRKNQINYVYQFSNSKNDFEVFDLKSFKNGVQESLCNEAYSIDVLKHDYTLKYDYIDKNKETIASIKTTKEDCGEGIFDLDYLKLILMERKL